MPPHNGLEPVIAAVRNELARRFPQATIETMMRRDFMIDDAVERAEVAAMADTAILFVGPAATSAHVTWKYGSALEQAGLPIAVAVPHSLESVVDHEIAMRGARLRHAAFRGTVSERFAAEIIDTLLRALTSDEQEESDYAPFVAGRYAAEGTVESIQRSFENAGMTDGLPINIPTDEAVLAMLAGTARAPNDIVCATLRPEGLAVSVEHVAINAVMAGAEPLHVPVILAAASLFGGLQLESMTRSVNSFAFTHLINGPLAGQVGISGGSGALGNGAKANAVIARAIALVLRNCGGMRLGKSSTPCQGNAAGITVFAENEDESPWSPLHTTLGFGAQDNVLTLFTGGLAIVGNFYYRGLSELAEQMKVFDSLAGALVLVSPKRAAELNDVGMDRSDVVATLHREASASLGAVRHNGFFPMMKAMIERDASGGSWPRSFLTAPDSDIVSLYPEDAIKLAVVGNDIASVMQIWNSWVLGTARIDDWA